MKYFINIVAVFLLTGISSVMAQIPYEVPKPAKNTPIDLSNTADLIIYVILPVVVIILAIIAWRYKKNKQH